MNKDDETVKEKQEPSFENPQAIGYSLTQMAQPLFASNPKILHNAHDAWCSSRKYE